MIAIASCAAIIVSIRRQLTEFCSGIAIRTPNLQSNLSKLVANNLPARRDYHFACLIYWQSFYHMCPVLPIYCGLLFPIACLSFWACCLPYLSRACPFGFSPFLFPIACLSFLAHLGSCVGFLQRGRRNGQRTVFQRGLDHYTESAVQYR